MILKIPNKQANVPHRTNNVMFMVFKLKNCNRFTLFSSTYTHILSDKFDNKCLILESDMNILLKNTKIRSEIIDFLV